MDSFRNNQNNPPGTKTTRSMNIVSVGIELELDSVSNVSDFGVGVRDTVGEGRTAVSHAVGVAIAVSLGTGWVAAF